MTVDEARRLFPVLERTALHASGLPGRGLVRASVGWWTSEDDLQRLAAALRE